MDNLSQNFENEHPPHEQFLLYVDGELPAKEAVKWQAHLDACWSCRVRVGKIEGTIADIIEFENTISNFQVSRDGQGWGNFDSRLNALVQEAEKKSLTSRFFDLWKQAQNLLTFNWTRKLAASSLAVLLIFAIFYQFITPAPVSASELLEKAAAQQQKNLKVTNQPVVYQKLRVRRGDDNAPKEMNWESWRDTTRVRYRQNVNSETGGQTHQELWQILQANGFNPQEPLSAATFADWRKTLVEKTDTVEKGQTEQGNSVLILRTENLRADSAGKISEGILTVRADDFHPIEQTLRITTAGGGIETYNFKELDYQVLSLDNFQPGFFSDPVEPQSTLADSSSLPSKLAETNANISVEPKMPSVAVNSNAVVKSVESPKAIASADLEVQVLDLLNQAKADLGEQITARRETDGMLYVRGIVETPQRKTEILKALEAVRNNPAVRVEIKTVDEALAEQKSPPKSTAIPETIESGSSAAAADNELLKYFKTEQAARAFSANVINHSSRAMNRAYALKRLVAQFKPEELKKLSPEARAKWLALVASHARAFREETAALRGELQPVFDAPSVAVSAIPDVNDITDVPRATAALLEFATTNDQIVRSAFTVSSGNTKLTAIRTAQFWQSLKNAEALAAKLQAVK